MSQSKIYVGNLSYQTSSDDLHEVFGRYGEVTELKLIMDRDTGRSKGFAFITFGSVDAANSALELDGTQLDGRQIKVSLAKEGRSGGGSGGGARHHRNHADGYHKG